MNKVDVDKEETFQLSKTVYGPIDSWRFGKSLGVDPLFLTSTCSFNCIYCQLGFIQNITNQIKIYVPTSRVIADYQRIAKEKKFDIIMYSGSGEPTLAENLGEIAAQIKAISPDTPQAILTNGVHLGEKVVQNNLQLMDKVIVKLDANSEKTLQLINRPTAGVTMASILAGIESFKRNYKGNIEVQTMLMGVNQKNIDQLCKYLKKISPKKVQLNIPSRAYPMKWYRENRGNHLDIHDHETRTLKCASVQTVTKIKDSIYKQTKIPVLTKDFA